MYPVKDDAVPPPPPHPPRTPPKHRIPLKQLWPALPEGARQKILQLLGRVIVRHLHQPWPRREVGYDRD
jgi:hypothetical protein